MTNSVKLRQFEGIVISDKMIKTVVVQVDRIAMHPKYSKQYVVSKKYKAHDQDRQYHVGDRVIIAACRPMSASKRWIVISKVKKT